jgi:hypothetical protein
MLEMLKLECQYARSARLSGNRTLAIRFQSQVLRKRVTYLHGNVPVSVPAFKLYLAELRKDAAWYESWNDDLLSPLCEEAGE